MKFRLFSTYILACVIILNNLNQISYVNAQDKPAEAAASQEFVHDAALKEILTSILKKKQITTFRPEDLKSVYFLEAKGKGVKDLSGLEHCTNLASVVLADNEITDLKPLSKLAGIQTLTLSNNKITDVSPLENLVKLQYLDLNKNEITNIKPLEKCTNLRVLYLSSNKLTDISVLSKFPKMTSLYLDQNGLTDISSLKELKWLGTLSLRQNKIDDLSPLAELKELRYTFIQGNPVKSLEVLVNMAKADFESRKQFAPYWRLYISKKGIDPAYLESCQKSLQASGVKLTVEE